MAVIEVIRFDGAGEQWLVYKWPKSNITLGSQLVVNQSQEAVFFKDGLALDVFGPGVRTLSTANIPLLQKVINLPFGGASPFVAEVYFVNKAAHLDLLWGTTDPIQVIEPKYQVIARIRSHGQMGIRVEDSRMFISQITGALGGGAVENHDRVQRYFKGLVMNAVKKVLADSAVNRKVSLFDISAQIDTLSVAVQQSVEDEFKRFGIGVLNFFIESIGVVEEDIQKLRAILEGKAEFEILGDERYTRKRTFDTFEKAAANPSGSGLAGAGLGLGVGFGAAAAVGSVAVDVLKKGTASTPIAKCPSCQKEIPPNSAFCNSCGARLEPVQSKSCPKCQVQNSAEAKFCSSCGANLSGGPASEGGKQ